jgi:hypothetical protein
MAKQRQAGVAEAGQILWAVPFASATLILAHRHIADPVQTILDAPMAAVQRQYLLGIGAIGPKACDRVRYFRCSLAVDDTRSLDANRLGKAWPLKIATQSRTDLEMADFNPPVSFVDFANFIKLLTTKPFAVGGKGRD